MHKFVILIILFLYGCSTKPTKLANNTAIECANNFIHSIFNGKFDEVNTIMLQNEQSKKCLQTKKFNYKQVLTAEQKKIYKLASVIIKKEADITEDTQIYVVQDPLTQKYDWKIKVTKQQTEWLVDFAYECSGNL